MKKEKVAVIIPIYKSNLNEFEIKSLNQCLKILNKYPIIFFGPESLNLELYRKIVSPPFVFKKFHNKFFSNIEGYNRLLLSEIFYKTLLKYEYILIYQLDAFVFKDELEYWCSLGYDYIGAPWFTNCIDETKKENLWVSGNGGFSLRRVNSMINLLSSRKFDKSPLLLIKQIIKKFKWFYILNLFGYKNTIKFHIANFKYNEDLIFSLYAKNKINNYKIPDVNESLKFSFDRGPEELFKINNFSLPFGCHGWFREDELYNNLEFWKKHIEF